METQHLPGGRARHIISQNNHTHQTPLFLIQALVALETRHSSSEAAKMPRRHTWADVDHQRARDSRGGAGLAAAPQHVPPAEEASSGGGVPATASAVSHTRTWPWGSALGVCQKAALFLFACSEGRQLLPHLRSAALPNPLKLRSAPVLRS